MSDASSEISDDALDKLVSRLVEVAEEDASMQSPGCTGASFSAESSGDGKFMGAATGQPIWPSSAPDQPSPIQPRRSPRPDGFDQEADLVASANSSDYSSEHDGEQTRPSLAMATSRDNTSFVQGTTEGRDAVGRGGHAGGSTKDGDEEANDEGLRRFARPCAAHDMVIEKMPQMEEEDNPWEALNSSLRKQGFREVSLTRHGGSVALPDPTSVADTLRDVVFKHGEREKVIQEMSLELQRLNNVSGHRDSVLNESFRREKSDLSRRSAGAEARVAVLEEEKERLQNQLANLIRRSKTETASLASQLKQSEHRVKAKEAEVQKLMDKLQDEAEKERLCQQRERAVLAKFQQKHTLRGGSTADESRAAESLVAHFSKAQRRSEAEMDDLRAQVSRLGDDLREKENTILQHRLGPDWTPDFDQDVKNTATSDDELRNLRARLAESERSVSVLKQRERRAQDRCANMEEQCIEVQTKADETQEALVNAQLELRSRPSLRNWRVSQRRVTELETKLSQATTQVKEAVGVAELRRWVDTAELMRRDRENHRLKLDRLEELPLDVLKQVVQDSCRLLALQDVSLLSSSVSKLIKAVSLLPRLERFVNSVCSFVFRHSPEEPAKKGRTMEDVLPLLEVWLARAQAPLKLKGFQHDLLRVLETRAGASQDAQQGLPLKRDRDVLNAVRHLVECERRFLREVHQNEQAGRSLNDPSPINRVVRHFQLLFGVTTLEGCLPKLNEVYRFSSETHTFLRTCGDLLNMSSKSNIAIMRRLETLVGARNSVGEEDCLLHVSHDAESWPKA